MIRKRLSRQEPSSLKLRRRGDSGGRPTFLAYFLFCHTVRVQQSVLFSLQEFLFVVKKLLPLPRRYQAGDAGLIVIACLAALVNGATMPVFSLLFARIVTVLYEPDPEVMKANALEILIAFIVSSVGVFIAKIAQVLLD